MAKDTEKDKLQEQAEMMNLAMESVATSEQARDLLMGKIQDAYLLKIRADIENRSGVMVVLVSTYKMEILLVFSLFGNSPLIKRIRTFEDFGQYCHDMVEVQKGGGIDKATSDMAGRTVYRKLTKPTIQAFLPMWERKDTTTIVNLIENGFNSELKVKKTKVQVDVEKISSVKFRYRNPLVNIITAVPKPVDEVEAKPTESSKVDESNPVQIEISKLEKEFVHVVPCKTVLSPVQGIDFDSLEENQRLLFILPFQTEDEQLNASGMGAVGKDGINRPIAGEFIKIIPGGKNEYHIFAKGPNGTLLRAFEERPVKLAVAKDKPASSSGQKSGSTSGGSSDRSRTASTSDSSSGSSLGMIVVAVVVVILVVVAAFLVF